MAACTSVVLVRPWLQYCVCRMYSVSLGWVSGAQSASRGQEEGSAGCVLRCEAARERSWPFDSDPGQSDQLFQDFCGGRGPRELPHVEDLSLSSWPLPLRSCSGH